MVGFNVENEESLNSMYICSHCSLLLRDPVQLTECGHRFCQSCINEQESDIITCSECRDKISRNKLIIDRGFKNDMQSLSIVCSLCSWTDILKNYQDHLDQIHPNPICKYCDEKFSSISDLDRHKQYNCEKITVYCPLKQFGCEEMILRINLCQHYLSEQHQKIFMNIVRHLTPILPNVMYKQSEISSQMTIDLSYTTENDRIQLEEFYEMINLLSGGIETLNDDIQRLFIESISHKNGLDPLTKDLSILKVSIEEQNNFLDGVKMNQQVLEQDLASMEQKINDMKTSSYDGTFVWKITNVQEKMINAQSERQTSIYSAAFYSSTTGYKMCTRLYLNGDGNARRTHMSLFFVLMRGQYDAILKFPFHYKVTFCLYDQSAQQRHLLDSFRPDIKSASFQRPRSDMNIASGIPKFVPLTFIQHDNNPYVRDDAMFIKVMIDFGDMPKTLLPYALSLNPGIPTEMQQNMIQQESERRQQQQIFTSSMAHAETDQSVNVNLQQTNTLLNIPTNIDNELSDPTNNTINQRCAGH
ncbi:unnamed protein product [Rotaria sordida]|uniref:Uncharacterized protein n=1 Tax=Rotaria sordida TaxID=392033 RepID=A0A814SSQ4_9BILA|nr:unnamed protein product [Rotaria sordida]CAF1143706.1 unnamed protein product [Rotaria sordida]CAF1152342.1 unnamed protein product [Rotaria sordida]CAF1166759.1 unnamed protein product [Rotaria sordida]CAF1418762.1 unnamed protein product [Rotaria sordida]